MASKIKHIILNGLNYAISATTMDILLKIKGLWKHIMVSILNPTNVQEKFVSKEIRMRWSRLLQPISLMRFDFTPVELTILMKFGINRSPYLIKFMKVG